MLGLTSYQEALRAIGALLGSDRPLSLLEQVDRASVEITTSSARRTLSAAELEELVLSDAARRGDQRPAGTVSDLLRAVGRALDELNATNVTLQLAHDTLNVRFRDPHQADHELTYAGDELEALTRAAAARRNGQPLRRVLILHASAAAAAAIVEVLVAEFAVQALPMLYARAVAAAAEPPDLVLAHAAADLDPTLDAITELRAGTRTRTVPLLLLAQSGMPLANLTRAVGDGAADDLLEEPVQPAQLRARVRTWMLRKPVGTG